MSLDRMNPEEIAELIDGTLTPAERERLLSALARSDDSYEDFLEAAAIQRELDQAPPQALPVTRYFRRSWPFASVLAAAALAFVVLHRGQGDDSGRLMRILDSAILATDSATDVRSAYGPNWDVPGWANVRGNEHSETIVAAFRAGVRFAELNAAVRSRDTNAIASARGKLVAVVSDIEGGALLVQRLEQIGQPTSPVSADAINLLRALGQSPIWFDLGAWLETARLAAIANRSQFFAPGSDPLIELQRIAAGTKDLSADEQRTASAILEPLRPMIDSPTQIDLNLVKLRIDSAFKAIAR